MAELINIQEQEYCFLGEGSKLKGEIYLKGTSHLACQLEGDVFMDSEQTLTIEHTGSIKGNLECHNLEIFGSIEGKINSSGKITIYPSGKVNVDLKSKSLVIHPGAIVNITGQTD